ncbi:MAG TPA: M20/M25/M40 family metallo-hydrolase [Terriglobales bacterium]|nr:M20/M25/M40 family metallo-hydrolase [Terriglobales bacterium]
MVRKLHILCLAVLMLACAVAAETPVEAARQYTTAHHEKLTQEFSEFLSIPKVAADPANLRRNADLLIEMLRTRSVESRLLSIPGAPPIVYGQITVPGAQHTIVFYAHYDGQPVTPSEWEGGSPFTPEIREVDGEPRIYARSAGDDKAATFQLTALDALHVAKIPLRANIRFVWEGEEEAGSPHLEQILDANRHIHLVRKTRTQRVR